MVSRASFIYREGERKTREQALHHLRWHRNSYVHAREGSDQTGAYLHQLRTHVERMLFFHLRNSSHFPSLDRTSSVILRVLFLGYLRKVGEAFTAGEEAQARDGSDQRSGRAQKAASSEKPTARTPNTRLNRAR